MTNTSLNGIKLLDSAHIALTSCDYNNAEKLLVQCIAREPVMPTDRLAELYDLLANSVESQGRSARSLRSLAVFIAKHSESPIPVL